jgi:transposase
VVAVRHNPVLRETYERHLAAGKAKKVALVAVARKLAVYLNSQIKNHPKDRPIPKPAEPEPKRRGRPRKVGNPAA